MYKKKSILLFYEQGNNSFDDDFDDDFGDEDGLEDMMDVSMVKFIVNALIQCCSE